MSNEDQTPAAEGQRLAADNKQRLADEEFVKLLTGEQMRLLYYLTMLLGDPHAAENVLQETSIVLWRKADEFAPGTNFSAWAHKVAYWQARAYVRDRGRDRHVFSEELMSQLTSQSVSAAVEPESRLALRDCLKNVRREHLEMLRHRYEDGLPIRDIADAVGRTEVAVRAALMRLRRSLQRCIESKLSTP